MADGTGIEWTDATWNPVTGCSIVSPGCTNCYAMQLAGTRLAHHPSRAGLTNASKAGPVWNGTVRLNEQWLDQPLRWKRSRMIFVCAHGDLFHEGVPDEWIDKIFAVMALCPQHVFQVLTKRSARMRAYFETQPDDRVWKAQFSAVPASGHAARDWPLSNVWLGVSAERQKEADERIPDLLATPAAKRFVSYEPSLGPIDFTTTPIQGRGGWLCPLSGDHQLSPAHADHSGARLDWIICGGESGKHARPMHPDWARSVRDQCQAAGVPFFFKQWGEHEPEELIGDDRPEPWRRAPDGRETWAFDELSVPREQRPAITFARVGKKRAGRLLDGVEHNGFPDA